MFWQSELGSNLVQGNPKVGARRSFAVTSSQEKKTNNNYRGNNYRNRNENNYEGNASGSNKSGCIFCGEQGHTSLFDCNVFKNVNMTARCRFVMGNRLCWHCLERGT